MKFTIFSDIHHHPGVSPSGDEPFLEIIQKRAEESGSDFILSGGDFTHGPSAENVRNYLNLYNNFHIPSYHALGNHDTDGTPLAETIRLYKMPNAYYYFDCKGYRIIICDPNYYLENGEYKHYDLGNYYSVPGSLRGILPPEQVAWLREAIDSAPGSCVIFSHESFEREYNGIYNLEEVRGIINEANKKRPHRVLLCINGHHHVDFLRIQDNVAYLELNSASFHCHAKTHTLFPKELTDQYQALNYLTCFNEPLHAVITVEGTQITIEGTEGSFFMGVSPEDTGNSGFDSVKRRYTPRISSAKFSL